MDYLKNVFQTIKESNAEDKVYSCQLLFPIIMSLIESVTSLIIGVHYSSQDKSGDATLFLKVAGGILLGFALIKIVAYFSPFISNEKMTKLFRLLDLSYFIVIIWGCVTVFGKFFELINRLFTYSNLFLYAVF